MAQAAPQGGRVKFCCIPEQAAAFRNQLPNTIDIVEIEDPSGARIFDPDPTDLEGWVHSIVRHSLKKNNEGKLVIHNLVNAKNIWSLWCMYSLGGYHLDTGVYPDVGGPILPEPKTFGVPRNGVEGTFAAWHTTVRFPIPWGTKCSTVVDSEHVLKTAIFPGATTKSLAESPSNLKTRFDVWFMRSPAAHKSAQLAFGWYIAAWCSIKQASRRGDLTDLTYKSASRDAIISAVATGVTHSGHGVGCLGSILWKSHIIATNKDTELPELKVNKLGFSSHR